MSKLSSNLNTRLLLIHFAAFLFIMYGFQMLSFLHDYDFLYFQHTLRMNFHGRFDFDMVIIEQSGSFGLIVAYIISWIVSGRHGWHWINSAIVLVVTFLLENLVLLHWSHFHDIYLSPGGLFHIYSKWGHIAIGIALLGVGVFFMLSKVIIRYISHETAKDKQKAKAEKKLARKGK